MTKKEKIHATTSIKKKKQIRHRGYKFKPSAWKMRCAALTKISKIFSRGFLNSIIIGIRYNVTITDNLIKYIIFNYKA